MQDIQYCFHYCGQYCALLPHAITVICIHLSEPFSALVLLVGHLTCKQSCSRIQFRGPGLTWGNSGKIGIWNTGYS